MENISYTNCPTSIHPSNKNTFCMRSMPMFRYRHATRSLSNGGERALRDRTKQCWEGDESVREKNAAQGQWTDVCVYFRQIRSFSLVLSLFLSCVKTGFLPSKHVSCFTNNSTGGKNSNKFMGEHSLTARRLDSLGKKTFTINLS